jgi:hypothetical protein
MASERQPHRNQVGKITRRDSAEFFFFAQQFRGVRGGSAQRLLRRHARFHEPA